MKACHTLVSANGKACGESPNNQGLAKRCTTVARFKTYLDAFSDSLTSPSATSSHAMSLVFTTSSTGFIESTTLTFVRPCAATNNILWRHLLWRFRRYGHVSGEKNSEICRAGGGALRTVGTPPAREEWPTYPVQNQLPWALVGSASALDRNHTTHISSTTITNTLTNQLSLYKILGFLYSVLESLT
jgi:hypothetical protein